MIHICVRETSADKFVGYIELVKSCQKVVKMTDKLLSKDLKIIFFTQIKVLFYNCLLFVSVVTSSKLTTLSKI